MEEQIEISRAPAEVFAFVADHLNDPKWCRKVKTVQPVGPGQWRVWHKPVPLRPVVVLETSHVRVDPPRYLAVREEDNGSVFEVEYRLEQSSVGTRFTQVSEFEWKNLPSLFQRFLALGVRRDVVHQLRELKRCLEHDV